MPCFTYGRLLNAISRETTQELKFISRVPIRNTCTIMIIKNGQDLKKKVYEISSEFVAMPL
jgi:hypothetical protein